MARDTAMLAWRPGVPIVFDSDLKAGAPVSSGTDRRPAQAIKQLSSSGGSSNEGTVSGSSVASVQKSAPSRSESRCRSESRFNAEERKEEKRMGKQPVRRREPLQPLSRAASSSQASLNDFWPPSKPSRAKPVKQEAILIEDSSFEVSSSPAVKNERSRTTSTLSEPSSEHFLAVDGTWSPTSANATRGEISRDIDSSVEHVASPIALALKYSALAQVHLAEVCRAREGGNEKEEKIYESKLEDILASSSPSKATPNVRARPKAATARAAYNFAESSHQGATKGQKKGDVTPCKQRIASSSPLSDYNPFQQGSSRRAFTTAAPLDKDPTYSDSGFDWDDPIVSGPPLNKLKPKPRKDGSQSASDSDSSDLPEIGPVTAQKVDMKGKGKAILTESSTAASARANTWPPSKPASAAKQPPAKPSSSAIVEPPSIYTSKKQLAREGWQLKKQKFEEKEMAKAERQEDLKQRYRQFSYDAGTDQKTPKVWWYRGDEFRGCDVRKGARAEEPKTLEEVVASLQGPLGFDLEWNFSRIRGKQYPVALLQLGDIDNIILYQTGSQKTLPRCLAEKIEDAEIIKLGVNIKADGTKLIKDFGDQGLTPRGFFELSDLAKQVETTRYAGVRNLIALQTLVEHWLDRYLDKGDTRVSNWERDLNAQQRMYAANDVFAALQVYRRMVALAKEENISVEFGHCIHDSLTKKGGAQAWRPRVRKEPPPKKPKSATAEGDKGTDQPVGSNGGEEMTVRQKEAWELWYMHELDAPEIAQKMGIKPVSVLSHLIAGLTRATDAPYDVDRLRSMSEEVDVIPKDARALDSLLQSPRDIEAEDQADDNGHGNADDGHE